MELGYDIRVCSALAYVRVPFTDVPKCSLQLVRHICSEHLLDEEHFLEWVILSFQTSGVDHLPSWFLVLRDQLTDMMRNRSRGRRLVEALLKQLNGVCDAP